MAGNRPHEQARDDVSQDVGQSADKWRVANLVPRLFRTTAFRVTIVYMLLFVVAVGLLGAFIYRATIVEQRSKVEQELREEIFLFHAVYEDKGLLGLGRFMDKRVSLSHTVLYYMVVPPYGNKIAGNLTNFPTGDYKKDELFEFTYELVSRNDNDPFGEPAIEVRPAMALVTRFPPRGRQSLGPLVLVGRDVTDIVSIRNAARSAIFHVGLVTLVLGLVVGIASSRAFLQRLDDINRTASAIRSGDLTKRIPLSGGGDEFDNLAVHLNMMLEQIERLMVGMRQVSDNIAHDLRSPLTRIRSRLDDALRADDASQRQALVETAEDVERLLATFNALLAMTRIESGERRKGFEVIDLGDLVEEIAELYEPAAEEAGFELSCHMAPVPPIYASRELISQALSNLLDNAFKYARHENGQNPRPKIEIRLTPKLGGGALLEVLDNGPGVAPQDRQRILNRFVRLDQSRTSTGSGLGLSMVAAVVAAHHASLSIGDGLARPNPEDGEQGYGLGVRIAFPPAEKKAGQLANSGAELARGEAATKPTHG